MLDAMDAYMAGMEDAKKTFEAVARAQEEGALASHSLKQVEIATLTELYRQRVLRGELMPPLL